ncbi:MAG: hypothetical protein KF784_04900 [Fimbriimonadaceae bacterium]|nr:hypothetical protein [Fimbriimonadaceae bacterium]
MRKLAFLCVVASLAIAGCGGGGGGNGGGGGGGGLPPTMAVNTTLLSVPGRADVTYNTGQGRAPGSITGVFRHLLVSDNTYNDIRDIVETQLNPALQIQLDGYSSQQIGLNVPMTGFSVLLNGRNFETFSLEIDRLRIENPNGTYREKTGPAGQPVVFEQYPMFLRAFPGRRTGITIQLDDAILNVDNFDNIVYDDQLFQDLNNDLNEGIILGSFSDYFGFDISNVTNKPEMSDTSAATRVYFSGDFIALSGNIVAGTNPFEVLVPLNPPLEGLVSPPNVTLNTDGTYALRQIDPRDLTNTQRIVSKQGTWREWHDPNNLGKSAILNPAPVIMLMLPQHRDGDKQEVMFFVRNLAGQIVDFYFGEVNYATNKINVWPIENVDDGAPDNEVELNVTSKNFRAGGSGSSSDIRSGSWALNAGTLPAAFGTSGTFLVVRP